MNIVIRNTNLALMKLSRHLKEKGHFVTLARRNDRLIQADSVYASCVFAFPQSARRVTKLRAFYGRHLELGGSGVDIQRRLPPAIEELPADYSLYPELDDRALGFLTRLPVALSVLHCADQRRKAPSSQRFGQLAARAQEAESCSTIICSPIARPFR